MASLKIPSVTKCSRNIANIRFSYVPLLVNLFRMRKEKTEEPLQVEILLETTTKRRLMRNFHLKKVRIASKMFFQTRDISEDFIRCPLNQRTSKLYQISKGLQRYIRSHIRYIHIRYSRNKLLSRIIQQFRRKKTS